jgi:2-hydroxychromene-2-carboxylate isomerase
LGEATRGRTLKTVELFFDYLSPYAYLAWPRVRRLCQDRGAELVIRPVLFAGLLNHWGQLGPAEIPPKSLFVLKDCARRAALSGLPLRVPRFHPFNSLTALRVSMLEVSGADQPRVIDALFHAGWGEGKDLGSAEEIAQILAGAGLDGKALVTRTTDPAVKDALRTATETAVGRGVFGIPTMIVDNELFWGNDQIDNVDRYLCGTDPIAELDLASLFPQGSSAIRRRPGT